MRTAVIALLAGSLVAGSLVPRPATDLTWISSDGQKLQLSNYKGKVMVLEILSTTCPHCQFTARELSKLQTEFGPRGLQVLGMAINDDANPAEFVRQNNVTFPVGRGQRDAALGFLQHSVMSPLYFPGLVFVDRNGVIQGQYSGADAFLSEAEQSKNLRATIQKLLSSGEAARPASGSRARRKGSR